MPGVSATCPTCGGALNFAGWFNMVDRPYPGIACRVAFTCVGCNRAFWQWPVDGDPLVPMPSPIAESLAEPRSGEAVE